MAFQRLLFKWALTKVGMAALAGVVVAWKVIQREDQKVYSSRSQKWAAVAGSVVGELSRSLSPKGNISRSISYLHWLKSRLRPQR